MIDKIDALFHAPDPWANPLPFNKGDIEAQEEPSIDDAPDKEEVKAHNEFCSSLDDDEAPTILYDGALDGDEVEAQRG